MMWSQKLQGHITVWKESHGVPEKQFIWQRKQRAKNDLQETNSLSSFDNLTSTGFSGWG